jgi:lipoprotein-anchoring transpeptidase ErfK/SrfK
MVARPFAAHVHQLGPSQTIMDHPVRFASGLITALLLGATGAAIAAPSPPPAGRPAVKATQQLAILNHDTAAFSSPTRASRPVAMVSKMRPITGEQTVLPVIAHATDGHGAAWLRVLLPGRPDSHTGWISARSTTPALTEWQITVRISTRQVTALRDGRLARTFKAVVGKPSTPTPLGRFFVEETVKLNRQDAGAPYALALSARSNVLQEFDGGDGQIALHGTNNIGGVLGTAASHGCIRLDTQAITWLATRIEPGVPVTITR